MIDLPSREFIKTNGERFKSLSRWVQEVALPIVVAYLEGRLVDREALQPCHVRRTLHQTDYPCNRQQHYWLPDE